MFQKPSVYGWSSSLYLYKHELKWTVQIHVKQKLLIMIKNLLVSVET